MRALIFGQAQYIATERGYVLANASMVVLYGTACQILIASSSDAF